MGTSGWGSRKNKRKSGHKGGIGMSGSGKRADHKKTLITKLYGHDYFGKQGVTSRKTKRDTRKRINVGDIELHLEKYAKKKGDAWEVNLKNYKILGEGTVKNKLNVTCLEISAVAREKIEKVGGSVVVKEIKEIVTPKIVNPKHEKKKAASESGKKK
jgi:large subunit ribosomal protein L15